MFASKLKTVLLAAFLATSAAAAQADVLNFDAQVGSTTVNAGDVIPVGKYYIEGAGHGGMAGRIGSSADCAALLQCPANGNGAYYSALQDGYFFLGMLDRSAFSLKSLDASFIGSGKSSYPDIAGLLYLTAFGVNGIIDEVYLNLTGPTSGSFNFTNYDLSGFAGGKMFTELRVASYACDENGNCGRTTNTAQFAIDNIVTIDAVNTSAVPEPGSFALLGLGLFGLLAARRRSA
jgi:hypothetical protein